MTTASHAVPASTNALLVLSLKAKSTLSTLTFVLIAALALMFALLALSLRANNSSCNTRQLNSLKSCMSCFSRQQLFFVPRLRTLGAFDWLKAQHQGLITSKGALCALALTLSTRWRNCRLKGLQVVRLTSWYAIRYLLC